LHAILAPACFDYHFFAIWGHVEFLYVLNKLRRPRAIGIPASLLWTSGAPSSRPPEFQELVAISSNSLKFLTPDSWMAFSPDAQCRFTETPMALLWQSITGGF